MKKTDQATRQRILKSALKRFAHGGYAGTSVQDIVDDARVTKPTLYYYFGNKAGLYQALVDRAFDERFRLIQAAAQRRSSLRDKLVEIIAALFAFLRTNRELMHLAFATAFAAPGEVPAEIRYMDKSLRNFEFIHALIKQGQTAGELDRCFDSEELAFGIFGLLNIYIMAHLLMPRCQLNRRRAERIVELFLTGSAARRRPAML